MNLENLLQIFVASNANELKIEPEAKPRLVSDAGHKNISETNWTAAAISQAIFPLIPLEEKLRLTSLPQIMFRHSNELGTFGVTLVKSVAGLNVLIKKISVPTVDAKTNVPAEMTPVAALNELADDKSAFKRENSVSDAKPLVTKTVGSATVSSQPRKISPPPSSQIAASTAIGNLSNVNLQVSASAVEDNDEDLSQALLTLESELAQSVESTMPPTHVADNGKTMHAREIDDPRGGDTLNQTVAAQTIRQPAANNALNSTAHFSSTAEIDALFYKMAERKASDLHLSVSMPPMIRLDGKMGVLDGNQERLTPEVLRDLLFSIMPEKNRAEFERRHDTDFAYEVKGLARFRANIFMDRKGMGAVFRIIPTKILTAEQLGLPAAVTDLCNLSKGLVVVTGPTGSGKSTTLAAMIDYLNRNRTDHIITIEDPIEFVHENQKCLLNQREVHNHTDSFKDALRAALREDPDVLLVGEMRDLETISIAIETAETGHLVFGTLHTTTAPSTVDRIIDQFPADRQQQIRVMLSESLKGVIAQTLLPKKGGGRVAALEILIVTPAISNLIREGKTFQIASAMQTGKQQGMVVLNDALVELVKKGDVEPHDAYVKAVDKTGLESLFKRHGIG